MIVSSSQRFDSVADCSAPCRLGYMKVITSNIDQITQVNFLSFLLDLVKNFPIYAGRSIDKWTCLDKSKTS